jgi:hypothetical protein
MSHLPVYFFRLRQCGFDLAEVESVQVETPILLTALLA